VGGGADDDGCEVPGDVEVVTLPPFDGPLGYAAASAAAWYWFSNRTGDT